MSMYLLTKNNCRYCTDFKNFLRFTPVGKKAAENIIILNKDTVENEEVELFDTLLKAGIEQGGQSYPMLISEDHRLLTTGFDATKVMKVLKENDQTVFKKIFLSSMQERRTSNQTLF